jgi:pimeloyl-ACP methyl ester carboxylesterase
LLPSVVLPLESGGSVSATPSRRAATRFPRPVTSSPPAPSPATLASVSHDSVRLAPDLGVPVLILHGDRDPEVPQQEIQRLMAALPHVELVTFRGAGHMLPLTHPDAVAEHTACWVRRLQPSLGRSEQT